MDLHQRWWSAASLARLCFLQLDVRNAGALPLHKNNHEEQPQEAQSHTKPHLFLSGSFTHLPPFISFSTFPWKKNLLTAGIFRDTRPIANRHSLSNCPKKLDIYWVTESGINHTISFSQNDEKGIGPIGPFFQPISSIQLVNVWEESPLINCYFKWCSNPQNWNTCTIHDLVLPCPKRSNGQLPV